MGKREERIRVFHSILNDYIDSIKDVNEAKRITEIVNKFHSLTDNDKEIFIQRLFDQLEDTNSTMHINHVFQDMNGYCDDIKKNEIQRK